MRRWPIFSRGIKFKVASCRWNYGLEHCAPSGHGITTPHIDVCSLSSLHDYAMLFVECSDSLRLFQGFSFNKKLIRSVSVVDGRQLRFQSLRIKSPTLNPLNHLWTVWTVTAWSSYIPHTNLLCSFLSPDDFFEAVQHHIRKMSSLVIFQYALENNEAFYN